MILPGLRGLGRGNDGKVGIGTSAPTGILEFQGGYAQTYTNGIPIIIKGQSGPQDWSGNGGDILLLPGDAGSLGGSSGRVGIGTTSPSYMLHVNGSVAGVGAYTQLSDLRYKKDITKIPNSLEKVLAIHGVTYKWIDENKYGGDTHIGVIAQEIEHIVPEVVSTGSDGVKRVRYSDLVPLLIEAFKREHAERNAENASKDTQISQLKAEYEQLKTAFCMNFPEMAFCSD